MPEAWQPLNETWSRSALELVYSPEPVNDSQTIRWRATVSSVAVPPFTAKCGWAAPGIHSLGPLAPWLVALHSPFV